MLTNEEADLELEVEHRSRAVRRAQRVGRRFLHAAVAAAMAAANGGLWKRWRSA